MNAIELLKKDHETVKSLFESFEKAKEQKDLESKASLFASIKGELEAHTRAEEEIFYPAFDQTAGEKDEDDKELVLEAGEEHLQVKTLLAELSEMEPDDERFDAKMKVMKDNVEHHVEEEEGEMFPHAQKELSKDELEQIGEQMDALKQLIKEEGPEAASGRKRPAAASRTRRTTRATARAATPRRSGGRSASGGGRSAKASTSRSGRAKSGSGRSRSKSGRSSRSR